MAPLTPCLIEGKNDWKESDKLKSREKKFGCLVKKRKKGGTEI